MKNKSLRPLAIIILTIVRMRQPLRKDINVRSYFQKKKMGLSDKDLLLYLKGQISL
jgi:hypothetical protein